MEELIITAGLLVAAFFFLVGGIFLLQKAFNLSDSTVNKMINIIGFVFCIIGFIAGMWCGGLK